MRFSNFFYSRILGLGLFSSNLLTFHSKGGFLQIIVALLFFNSALGFKSITDLVSIDIPGKKSRFLIKYLFLSKKKFSRVCLQVSLNELEKLPSLVKLYPGINWLEREMFDLMGILFNGHPDLRRILLDYGFDGHPLRKDYPVSGYWDLYYDDVVQLIQYIPLVLAQSWRSYQFHTIKK